MDISQIDLKTFANYGVVGLIAFFALKTVYARFNHYLDKMEAQNDALTTELKELRETTIKSNTEAMNGMAQAINGFTRVIDRFVNKGEQKE